MERNQNKHPRLGKANLPVNLLVEGEPCLVVGGGPVAFRKVKRLLTAGAGVRVVSPELCPELAALAKAEKIRHEPRCFEEADVNGNRLVFAAANDRAVNRQVLKAARTGGALCCCVDGNWPAGDFTTPATLHRNGLTVSVSTGGRSCRQSRLVKDTLGRHIQSIESADLLILGTSHEQLSLDRREAVQRAAAAPERMGDMLMHVWGIHEFMLLNTCNRFELIAIASSSAGQSGILERLLGLDALDARDKYRGTGEAAFTHMALVTAGMLSQSPGEYHVASQVKEALHTARERGWANSLLQAWVAEALHVSKHIKNEVTPLLPAAEIEDVSVAYADERKGDDWSGLTVLVVGAGVLGRNLVEMALARKARCVWGYRSKRPKRSPSWKSRVQCVPPAGLAETLERSDIVFCAAGTSEPVLREEHASRFHPERPVLVMDLGAPRNVSPELRPLLPEAEFMDLDRLKAWSAQKDGSLSRALTLSRAIIEQHKDRYATLITRFQGRNPGQ